MLLSQIRGPLLKDIEYKYDKDIYRVICNLFRKRGNEFEIPTVRIKIAAIEKAMKDLLKK